MVLPRALASAALWLMMMGATSADAAGSAYVTDYAGEAVSQYSLTGAVLTPLLPASVATELSPVGIAVSPDGRSVYVASFSKARISQYDVGADGALTPKAPAFVATVAGPEGIAVSPDGTSVYVANAGNAVSQYTVGAGGVLIPKSPASIATGGRPTAIAVSPDATSVYVSDESGETISQFSVGVGGTLAAKSPATVATGMIPGGIALSPDGKSAYVANFGSNTVSEYDVGAGGLLAPKSVPPVTAGGNPTHLAVSPDGKSAYVTNNNGAVSQYDVGTGGLLSPKSPASVPAGSFPWGVSVSPDGKSVYIPNASNNNVSQYAVGSDGALSSKSPSTVPAGESPHDIALTPDQGPIASFSASAGVAGTRTTFNGAGSTDSDGSVARYDWSFGDGTSAANAGPQPAHTYASPGTYTVTLQATDNSGCSAREVFTGQTAYCNASLSAITSAIVAVRGVPAASVPAPFLTSLRQSASRWREGNKLARISSMRRHQRRPPVGTTFSFVLNEQATTTFSFLRRITGRKLGAKCVAKTRKNATRKSCRRSVIRGTLSFGAHSGTNKVAFQGRIARYSKRLTPGRYALSVLATNSAGARSAPASLAFTILR
jgi:DNA-binding beta-propeller fold protein YncE